MTDTKGEKKGKKTKGIYSLDGEDTLKMAMPVDEKAERPTEFTTKKDSKHAVMTLRKAREKVTPLN